MKMLIINAGSSSLKFKLYDIQKSEEVLIQGIADGIGLNGSFISYTIKNQSNELRRQIENHKEALRILLEIIKEKKLLKSLHDIKAVGHRAVHGGEEFKEAVLVDDKVIKRMEDLSLLAPLHNPPNLLGIKLCRELLPRAAQVAVFDTGFHRTMPEEAYLYPIPYLYYQEHRIRRYGFHGTSHHYVSEQAAAILGTESKKLRIISCHLGNGSSIAAVCYGKSIDTSMGFTPLPGIVMGTRCGDIDPAIITFLMKKEYFSAAEIDEMLNKRSGLLGISGISPDVRVLWAHEKKGNARAHLALEMLAYSVTKYIGAYCAAMNGVDAIAFTAGIGENAYYLRERILSHFSYLGLKLDRRRNERNESIISADDSQVKVLVIHTDEELQIARETFAVASSISSRARKKRK